MTNCRTTSPRAAWTTWLTSSCTTSRSGIQDTDIKAADPQMRHRREGRDRRASRRCCAPSRARTAGRACRSPRTRTRRAQQGLNQQRIFAEEGVDLRRVVIGHSGDTEDIGYLEKLMAAGSYIGMDRFGLASVPADREARRHDRQAVRARHAPNAWCFARHHVLHRLVTRRRCAPHCPTTTSCTSPTHVVPALRAAGRHRRPDPRDDGRQSAAHLRSAGRLLNARPLARLIRRGEA